MPKRLLSLLLPALWCATVGCSGNNPATVKPSQDGAPTRCGDGVVDSDEECDDGPANSDTLANACRTTCVRASCGDGVVDNGEICDDGPGNSDLAADACNRSCTGFPDDTPLPLIECFGVAPGCTRGTLETAVGDTRGSPYGQGPVFQAGGQPVVSVRPARAMDLHAGTIYLWARHFSPFVPGETHVLAHFAIFDGNNVVDTANRANLILRDGTLEGTVADDVVTTTPLDQAASWEHEALAAGEWHQYALAWDQDEERLYLDGGLVSRATRVSDGMTSRFEHLYVGARFTGEYSANSQVARLAVWDRRLTHIDIQGLFKQDLRRPSLAVAVSVAGADHVTRDRLEVNAGETLAELSFHFVSQVQMDAGARLMVAFPWSVGEFLSTPPVSVSAVLPAGATGAASCYRPPRLPQGLDCMLHLASGSISAGQEAVIVLSQVAIAAAGSISRIDSDNLSPQVFVDPGGNGQGAGALIPAMTTPRLAVVTSASAPRLEAFARMPSTVEVGQVFSLHVWAEKSGGAPDLARTINLGLSGPPELAGLSSSLVLTTAADGSAAIDNLVFTALPAENPVRISGSTDALALNVNPVEVLPGPGVHLYWGDIHGHTTLSDGKEPPAHFYEFAKDRGLEFAAMSDHECFGDAYAAPWEIDNIVDHAHWQIARNLAHQHDEPGKFVALAALEICAGAIKDLGACGGASRCPAVEGDWNVYFTRDDVPLVKADAILPAGGFLDRLIAVDPNAVMIPHYGGRRADLLAMSVAQNAHVPAVEIISNHTAAPAGASIWGTEYLSARPELRLGLIGSSDDHSGHPGRSMFWTRQGIMALWTTALTREGVLDAIRKRHVYAYSHDDRPILRSSANRGSIMGDSVLLAADESPSLSLSGSSARTPNSVDLYKDGTLLTQIAPPVVGTTSKSFSVSYVDTALGDGPASYYWHVRFDDDAAAAWTSPIWFSR
jgi:hypothetical protein